jgi:type I restriction enzyme M protein
LGRVPSLRSTLFKPNRPGYRDLAIAVDDVQQAVLDSDEFKRFASDVYSKVGDWFAAHRPTLEAISADTKTNDLIATIGDDLLERFRPVPLLDEYDAYEQLMTYWHATMHDDVYLIMNEGWIGAAKPRKTIEDKDRKLSETPDLIVGSGRSATKYKMDLIPPALVVARYFTDEQAKIGELTAQAEDASRAVEEYAEEHAVEDGLLADAVDDDKISKALVTARLRIAKMDGPDTDEITALEQLIKLYNAEADAKKATKEAQAKLDLATLKKYGDLAETDARMLVLDDKWLGNINTRIAGEVNSLTLALVARIQQLGKRYEETVEELGTEIGKIEAKVARHLADMGVE